MAGPGPGLGGPGAGRARTWHACVVDAYRERLDASPAYWVVVPLAGVFAGAALLPVSSLVAGLVATVAAGAVAIALVRAAAAVEVDDGVLRAGRARLPVQVVSGVDVLDRDATRAALGVDLDARAYTCTRPWVPTAVRIHLADPGDPTPYWLISSRYPTRLAATLTGDRGPDQPAHSEQTS